MTNSTYTELLDYRRNVAEMYAAVRRGADDPAAAGRAFRTTRDHLFKTHPQSPLTAQQQAKFDGLHYFPYDPDLRYVLPIDPAVEAETFTLELNDDGPVRMRRFGKVHFVVADEDVQLSIFWILGYGGGLFLPFRDRTNSDTTYGGGRYLLDTIKHADLGQQGAKLVLDFNYAFNPSCAYNERWHCPLAPIENRLPVPITAGELAFAGEVAPIHLAAE